MRAEELIAAAIEQTGLSKLGDERIIEPLQRLTKALTEEAKLNESGLQRVEANLVATLSNRLRIEDYLLKNSSLLSQAIEKPTFVFGLPRTGTTLLINLLNVDPARRCFLRWEAADSVPPPHAHELHAGPRYQKSQEMTELSLKYAPHISAIHHEDADSPTECQFAMSPSFIAQYYDSMYHIPSYHHWLLHEADYLPAFEFHKRFLQCLQANTGGQWTLKNPWHPLFLDDLSSVYPDAQLVMTHRDPVEVVASACSLVKAVRPMFSDNVDFEAIGQCLLETFDVMIERTLAYKKKHGWNSIYDLQYTMLMHDPMAEMRKLHKHFEQDLSAEAEAAMLAYIEANPKGKHGQHSYDLADYGLTADGIRERYSDYCSKFEIAS